MNRIKNRDPKFVYLENKRIGVKIPLLDSRGFLNGVFETRDGEIVEIRYQEEDSLVAGDLPRSRLDECYRAWIGTRLIGEVSPSLGHREIIPQYERQRIGTELFNVAERAFAQNKSPSFSGKNSGAHADLWTNKKDTAAFLFHRGYRGVTSEDKKRLAKFVAKRNLHRKELVEDWGPSEGRDIRLFKTLVGNAYDDPLKWHRIKVLGRNGKQNWLTLRVLPVVTFR